MSVVNRLMQAFPEFRYYSRLVAASYGGSALHWKLDMAWCLVRYGARPMDYARFEFHRKSAKERNRYLTIYRYFRAAKHFGAGLSGVSGKVEEYRTFAKFICRDWVEINKNTPPHQIESFVKRHGTVIAKPVGGEQGKGVLKIGGVDTDEYRQLIEEKGRASFVMEECVENCPELSAINPSSLNTVRATTFIDNDGLPRIVSMILRVGAPGSHVDNWGAGGVGYNFDLETGVCNMYGRDKKNRPYVYHPGSNVQMIGFKLPRFEELTQFVYELTSVFPQARYVGWDIAITPNGFELIEMNCPAGHDMFQTFDNPIYELMKKNW